MQMPVRRIEGDLDVWNDASRLVDLGEHHQAIGAGALDPAHMMIGRAQPRLSLAGNRHTLARFGALLGIVQVLKRAFVTVVHQTAVSGSGINGKPPNRLVLCRAAGY